MVYSLIFSLLIPPVTAIAQAPTEKHEPGAEGAGAPAAAAAFGPECSKLAFEAALEKSPLLYYGNHLWKTPIYHVPISGAKGYSPPPSSYTITGYTKHIGKWYYHMPYGYRSDAEDPDDSKGFRYDGRANYPHFKIHFDQLLSQAMRCLSQAPEPEKGKKRSEPAFVTELRTYLETTVPKDLSYAWKPNGERYHRKYNKALHDQIVAFENLAHILDELQKRLEAFPGLAKAVAAQLKEKSDALKDERDPKVVGELKALALQIHELLEADPEFSPDSLKKENRLLYELLFQAPPEADSLFGVPTAAQLRDFVIRGDSSPTKEAPKISLVPKTPNYVYRDFPQGGESLTALKELLVTPTSASVRLRHGLRDPGDSSSPFYWLNQDEDSAKKVRQAFEKISPQERQRVLEWIGKRLPEVDDAKTHGDSGSLRLLATTRETLLDVKRKFEAADHGEDAPDLDPFEYARSSHYLQRYKRSTSNHANIKRLAHVAEAYEKATGEKLAPYVEWRYLNLHPFFKDMVDDFIHSFANARLKSDGIDRIKRMMRDLSHEKLADMARQGFGQNEILTSLIEKVLREMEIDAEEFERETGVNLKDLMRVLNKMRVPFNPWLEEFGKVMGTGNAYKGEKVRDYLVSQLEARHFLRDLHKLTDPDATADFGKQLLKKAKSWFGFQSDMESEEVSQEKHTQKLALFVGALKDFYSGNKHEDLSTDVLKAKLKDIAGRFGLEPSDEALSYLAMSGLASRALSPKGPSSPYWNFDERQVGALTTFIALLDETGHDEKQLQVADQDRYHPSTVAETIAREKQAEGLTISALHARGLIPKGTDVREFMDQRFERLRRRILQDPTRREPLQAPVTLMHRGAPAATRIAMYNLMLPENEAHVEMLERLGASHAGRDEAATDNREHIPANLYRMLALEGDTDEITQQLRALDPKAFRHFACFHRPDTLKKGIMDAIIENDGVLTPQAEIELELLAATELYILETGECDVLSFTDIVTQFYFDVDPKTGRGTRDPRLASRMAALRGELGRLAADQVRRGVKTKFGTNVPGSFPVTLDHVNDPADLRGWIINELVHTQGKGSPKTDVWLAELAMHAVDPEKLKESGSLAYLDLRGGIKVEAPVRAKMGALRAELAAVAKGYNPESAARGIVAETIFSDSAEQFEAFSRFGATLPKDREIKPDERQKLWEAFIKKYAETDEWKAKVDREMENLQRYAEMAAHVRDNLSSLEDRIANPYAELAEEGTIVDIFEGALATVLRREKAKAHSSYEAANRSFQEYLRKVGPNPNRRAIDVVNDRKKKNEEADKYHAGIELAGRITQLRSQIFNGTPDQELALSHFKAQAQRIRDQIPPERIEGEEKTEPTLGAELNARVRLLLAANGVEYTNELNAAINDFIQQAGKACAFGRSTSQTDQACDTLEEFLTTLLVIPDPNNARLRTEKAKVAHDFVNELQQMGQKRFMASVQKAAKDYIALILENTSDLSARERASLEHGALEIILDTDNRMTSRDDEEWDQLKLASELALKKYKPLLEKIADPVQRAVVEQDLIGTFRFVLNEAGHDLAKLESLADSSFLPFASIAQSATSPHFAPLLASVDEDWAGGNAALDASGPALQRRLEALQAKAKPKHQREQDRIRALTKKLYAIGADFDGVTITLDDRSRWSSLIRQNDREMERGGWSALRPGMDTQQVHRERMKELQQTLDALDNLGVPVAVNLTPNGMLSDAPSSYDRVVDAIVSSAWRNLQTTTKWNPVHGDLAVKAQFDENGELKDVDFSTVSALQHDMDRLRRHADAAYGYYNKAIDEYGSFWGSTLPHFAMNLGNYGDEWKNPRQRRLDEASNEYLHVTHLLRTYGGIPVSEDSELNGEAVYREEMGRAQMILFKEKDTIEKVLRDIDMLEEAGWTIIITVGTFGVGAYLTTIANAARLISAGRVIVQGGRLVAVGARGTRAALVAGRTMRLAGWSAKAAQWLAVGNRIKYARGILATVRYARHAGKKGLEGAAWSIGGLEVMTALENKRVRDKMAIAIADYDAGKFDSNDPDYMAKFGDEWKYMDTDGDGIPDWHQKDLDQEQEYLHPSFAQTWDSAESGFLFFAGMTAAGPLKVPYLPQGWQGVNQRLFAPTIHVATGSLTADVGMGVRRGEKGLDEALVDAALTGLIMAPAAYVASSPVFYKFKGAERFGLGRTAAITSTTGTIVGSHMVGEPLKHEIKGLLGFNTPLMQQNKDYWQEGAEIGQHALFAWMMTKGGKLAHIRDQLKKPDVDIAQLKARYGEAEIGAALSMLPRAEIETGYEVPTVTNPSTGLTARTGRAAARQATRNEPLLRELAQREGMDVDTYAMLLQMAKSGVTPADFASYTPPFVTPTGSPRKSGAKPVISSNTQPVTLPGTTGPNGKGPKLDFVREMLGFKPKGAKDVHDSAPTEIGELGGAMYRRMWELARRPEANGVPREKLTEEARTQLEEFQTNVAKVLEENPALMGQFNPKADDLANPTIVQAVENFGTMRTVADGRAMTGTEPNPQHARMVGEMFSNYVLRARAEGTDAVTMDYLYNQFQANFSNGRVTFTETDWLRYEAVYNKPRPAWVPPGPPAYRPPTGLPGSR